MADPLLSVRNLRVNFRLDKHTTFEAVKGVSFDIPRNATVALVGESGSGKSVTSLSILGLLPKENASVLPGSEILYGGRNLVALDALELRKLRGAARCRCCSSPMTSRSWATSPTTSWSCAMGRSANRDRPKEYSRTRTTPTPRRCSSAGRGSTGDRCACR